MLFRSPAIASAGFLLARRMFHGNLRPLLTPVLIGLAAKAAGSSARYWVAFDAYGGTTDAQRYHRYAKGASNAFWSGAATIDSVLPQGTGTRFLEHTTAFLYTFLGSSRLAAFLIFGFMAWVGSVFYVKAAVIGIPMIRRVRYAWLVMLWPSMIYWPASIGKEAVATLFLGISSYGLARVLQRQWSWTPLAIAAAALGIAGLIRAHLALFWLVGLVPALLVSLLRGVSALGRANRSIGRRASTALVLVVVAASV